MQQPKTERLLSLVECERLTGRKVATWRKDILMRKIAYVKIGRQVRIPLEIVDGLIRDGWVEPVRLKV